MTLKRKIKETESIQEYFLIMREIASQGSIETDALFDYLIDGLGDCSSNKAILYGAKTIIELKERLKTYGKIRKSKTGINSQPIRKPDSVKYSVKEKKWESSNIKALRCFYCGVAGHLPKDCKNEDRGTKCFQYNEFGHIATKCKVENVFSKSSSE